MEAQAGRAWFLRKHEGGEIFGPLSFEQLAHWAARAQIAPNDSISTDRKNWTKAPMLPELAMDWIVEVTSEHFYGPTTLGAIAEFLRLGEIDLQTFVINSCNATRRQARELAPLLQGLTREHGPDSTEAAPGPPAAGMSIAVQDRIRELERALQEERRALADSETRYRELEAKYRALASGSRT